VVISAAVVVVIISIGISPIVFCSIFLYDFPGGVLHPLFPGWIPGCS